MQELAILLIVVTIFLIIPSLLFLTFNFFVQYFLLKPSHQGFSRTLKRTWWTSILCAIAILASFFALWELPDSMPMRILATLLMLIVLFALNALHQSRMNTGDASGKSFFKKSMIASFGISSLIVLAAFVASIPKKIIPESDKARFYKHIEYMSACNATLKSINERGIAKGDLLHALYNDDERALVAFIRLSTADRKDLMKQFRFQKIDTSDMGEFYLNAMGNDIKDVSIPIGTQTFNPKKIGQQDIFQYSRRYTSISMNMATSYQFSESFTLECESLPDHYCYVQMIFDASSDMLLLVEEINHDGP